MACLTLYFSVFHHFTPVIFSLFRSTFSNNVLSPFILLHLIICFSNLSTEFRLSLHRIPSNTCQRWETGVAELRMLAGELQPLIPSLTREMLEEIPGVKTRASQPTMLDIPTMTTTTAVAMMLEHLEHTETINVSAAVKKGNLLPHSFVKHTTNALFYSHRRAECPNAGEQTCRYCKKEGHLRKDCPEAPPMACTNCGQEGMPDELLVGDGNNIY